MSPSPTDVGGYRNTPSLGTGGGSVTPAIPIPLKKGGAEGGTPQHEDSGSLSSRPSSAEVGSVGSSSTQDRPLPISASSSLEQQTSTASVGGGSGNMPSGISVQELKQMTALRMAHEQGHLRVVSPFHHNGENFFFFDLRFGERLRWREKEEREGEMG